MKKLVKFIGALILVCATKGLAVIAYLIWKYGIKVRKPKDGIKQVEYQQQHKIIAILICVIGLIINSCGTPQTQTQTQTQQQVTCKFDTTGYKQEQRSTMLMYGRVGDKYYNIDALRYKHKSGATDDAFTQVISWEQGDVVYGLYLHGNGNTSFVTKDNCKGAYITITSIEHEVVLSTELMKAGLYSGRDIKMVDVYIAHATVDHVHADDEEE